jgi:hypothetical protein
MPSTIAMAARAQLENEAFQAAIIRMEETQLDIIRASGWMETSKRENAYQMLRVIANFIDELKAMTSDDAHERGRAAAQQLMK